MPNISQRPLLHTPTSDHTESKSSSIAPAFAPCSQASLGLPGGVAIENLGNPYPSQELCCSSPLTSGKSNSCSSVSCKVLCPPIVHKKSLTVRSTSVHTSPSSSRYFKAYRNRSGE